MRGVCGRTDAGHGACPRRGRIGLIVLGVIVWDFSTESEFQANLDWMAAFIRNEIEPLDQVIDTTEFESPKGAVRPIVTSLTQGVRDHHLWAYHQKPEPGG